MTQDDMGHVKSSAGQEIRFGIVCFVVSTLTAAGLVVIGVAECQDLISWHYLFTLVWTLAGTGWSVKCFRRWWRHQSDLMGRQKEIWTTTNVERRISEVRIRWTTTKRHELIVDGDAFLIPHHRLNELFHGLRNRRSTTVEVSRYGRELLAARQGA